MTKLKIPSRKLRDFITSLLTKTEKENKKQQQQQQNTQKILNYI